MKKLVAPVILSVFLAITLVVLSGCLPQVSLGQQSPRPASGGRVVDEAPLIPTPPDRDLFDVAQRLKTGGVPVPRTIHQTPPEYSVGQQQVFWLTDLKGMKHFTTTATLRYVTPHAYMYVEDGQNVSEQDIQNSALEFEDHIFPTVTRYFGEKWYTGIDNDEHLTIVNARIPAAAGYFSSSDQYPTAINPYSNQRKAIYMNLSALRPGSASYYATLSHEFLHALYWNVNPYSEAWINEGAAEVSAELNGFPSNFIAGFLNRPDTQLDTWPDESNSSGPYYGGATLFIKYLAQHYGGYEALKEIIASPGRGPQGITDYLAGKGYGVDFDTIFKDWVVANYLQQPGGGRYGYAQPHPGAKGQPITRAGEHSGTVNQYAADYLELGLGDGDYSIGFQGAPQVKLIPDEPHGGQMQWWANRGDSIDTTLTREFDLEGLSSATLQFWTWYELENTWDYAYVEVSVDGGTTWNILTGHHTTTANPLGNSFGQGYTGTSGGGKDGVWVEDSVDLSAFAGQKVLVRFEYITDEEVNTVGFTLDDISVPELGFTDDAEADNGWEARGFFRTANSLKDRLTLQIIKYGQETAVQEVPVDEDGHASLELLGLGTSLQKAVVVVSAQTPVTTEPAPYTIKIAPLRP